ncbi:SpoIID/LytB domain-containing protein [Desulfosporosinus sp. Sb-LF]|uniref:SpoIID/LytB domain-containing protein n=1 Tax=Desulfosporosinus sp. Sb-LF TaxID=2560027 RepID=UPI00107FAC14|nr:SpoIID/LytB domain-containing protein [Desulfosporosinus sp. Sb-LF]TGE34153.1 SpoIID/LytB domain-containing protein [Desulfosporosinus sp. Sb-LF]
MLRFVYRLSFLCMALFVLVVILATPCQAKEISVELLWKLGQAGWAEINVDKGEYQLIVNKTSLHFPTGSTLQVSWGGWTPVLRINHGEFQVFDGSLLELKGINPGGLRVKTPEGQDVVYRGGLQLSWQDSHWRFINRVDSEDYLKGVVPIEMSNEWAKGGMEGLKAQTVAARTFLIKHTENGRKTITDSPDIDQAYGGKNAEGEASVAVEATRGEILVDAQSKLPIEALYSSHSGGFTEDAKNVWGNADTNNVSHPDPYSQGVGGAVNHWRFIVSAPILGTTFGLGPVRSVELDKFPSGRVKSVRMEDGIGHSKTVTGRAFVKAFYPFGQPIRTAAFLGNLFEVKPFAPNLDSFGKPGPTMFRGSQDFSGFSYPKEQGPLLSKVLSSSLGTSPVSQPFGVFLFEGRGWGHGVGMSQWGAYHMAQMGYNYQQILTYYYHNTIISE